MKSIIFLLFNFILLQNALANKCLIRNDLEGIMQSFSTVIKGEIVERTPHPRISHTDLIQIRVLEVEKGTYLHKFITGKYSSGKGVITDGRYQVGEIFYFPVVPNKFGEKNEMEVSLPASGCPFLPRASRDTGYLKISDVPNQVLSPCRDSQGKIADIGEDANISDVVDWRPRSRLIKICKYEDRSWILTCHKGSYAPFFVKVVAQLKKDGKLKVAEEHIEGVYTSLNEQMNMTCEQLKLGKAK